MRCTLKILLCKYVMGNVLREPFIIKISVAIIGIRNGRNKGEGKSCRKNR